MHNTLTFNITSHLIHSTRCPKHSSVFIKKVSKLPLTFQTSTKLHWGSSWEYVERKICIFLQMSVFLETNPFCFRKIQIFFSQNFPTFFSHCSCTYSWNDHFNLFKAKHMYTCDFCPKEMFVLWDFTGMGFYWYGFGMVPGLNSVLGQNLYVFVASNRLIGVRRLFSATSWICILDNLIGRIVLYQHFPLSTGTLGKIAGKCCMFPEIFPFFS